MAFKIKTRKELTREYTETYDKISKNQVKRIEDFLGDKLTEKFVDKYNKRIKNIRDNMTYSRIEMTLYEVPMQSHRPRSKGRMSGLYVPNARENWDFIGELVQDIKDSLEIVCTPAKFICEAYYSMPKGLKPEEVIALELKQERPIGAPDFDNVLKAYCDMIQKHILVNDDIICSSSFEKYASLLPRVEICIIYQDYHTMKSVYKNMIKRKTFIELEDRIKIKLLEGDY
jgi:Holliday junction resolvase RusA-like endonuclease